MTAGRHPKPLERRANLEKGDGQGTSHGKSAKGKTTTGTQIVEYTPASMELVKPSGLKKRGSLEWEKIWEAGKVWLHPAEDYPWVEQICFAYDEIDSYRRSIRKEGLLSKGYAGQTVANPLIKEIRAAEATIRKCLAQIGFSPTDRARLGLAEIKRQSSLADLQDKTRENRSE